MSEQTPPATPTVPPVAPQQPPAAPVPPATHTQPGVPPAQPANDLDVNAMIANIEAETQKQQAELRTQIMTEAETKFNSKLQEQKQASDAVMNEMKAQLDALTKASEEQKRTVIEDYKAKLSEQAGQLKAIEGELSQRTSNVPAQNNPYRAAQPKANENGETLDPRLQKQALAQMYNAVSGKDF